MSATVDPEAARPMEAETERLRHFFNASQDNLCIAGFDGYFKRLNPAWRTVLGYTFEELLAQPYLSFVHPDDVERTRAEASKLAEGAASVWFENRYRCRDGSYKWLVWRATPDLERNVIYAAARDITSQKEVERKLLETTQLYRAVLDGGDFMIISTDAAGVIRTFNAAAERCLGYAAGEVVGLATPALYHEPAEIAQRAAELSRQLARTIEPGLEALTAKASLGQPDENEWTYRRKDGSRFPGQCSVTALRDRQGQITGFMGIARDVTARKEMEDQRRALESRLQAILDNATAVIFLKDLEGRYLMINKRWSDLFHVGQQEIVGKRDDEIFPPDLAEAFRANDAAVLAAGKPMVVEEVAPHDDGPHTYLSVKFPLLDPSGRAHSVGGIATDITDRKRAEARLSELSALQRGILDSANYAMISTDPGGVVTTFNAAAEKMLGYAAGEIVGKATPAVWHDPDEVARRSAELSAELGRPVTPGFETFVAKARRGGADENEWTLVRRDGSRFPVSLSVTALRDQEDSVTGWLGVIADITVRKQVEADLYRSNRDLEQFAYIASHDLKEPLRMVTSYLQLLERRHGGSLDAEAQSYLRTAVDGAARMRALIDSLLAYSRVGTQARPLAPADLSGLLETAIANLAVVIGESGAVITRDPLPVVLGDAAQLVQLLQNLLANAIKFRSARPPAIHVGASRQGEVWTFSVRDNGIGIEPRFFDRIFEIFQRLHTREEYEGTGIGLALCRRILERHGGRIWVESVPGEGTAFHFTLSEGGAAAPH